MLDYSNSCQEHHFLQENKKQSIIDNSTSLDICMQGDFKLWFIKHNLFRLVYQQWSTQKIILYSKPKDKMKKEHKVYFNKIIRYVSLKGGSIIFEISF